GFFKTEWAKILKRALSQGIDGICVYPDEYYYKGHNLASIAKNDPCHERFKAYCGKALPTKVEDSYIYRKWVVFNYESIGNVFEEILKDCKKAYPKALIIGANIGSASDTTNLRMAHGIALDVVGHSVKSDIFVTDPYFSTDAGDGGYLKPAIYTKKLIGAAYNRKAGVVNNAASWYNDPASLATLPPHYVSCGAVSSIMHGGKGVAYYRYNYLFREGNDKWAKKAFSIMDFLDAVGNSSLKVPKKIALIYSRASEDWWQLKIGAEKGIDTKTAMTLLDLPEALKNVGKELRKDCNEEAYKGAARMSVEMLRGFVQNKILMEMLIREGYPFDLYYQEQLQSSKELADYKLVILPFSYAMSEKAAKILDELAKKGTKILIYNKLGDVDEYGIPYPKPIMEKLATAGNVTVVTDDITRCFGDAGYIKNTKTMLDSLLGNNKPLLFNRFGHEVEAGVLERSETAKFLLLNNWSKEVSEVEAGIIMPVGYYHALEYNGEIMKKVRISGNELLKETDVKNIRVHLEPGETKVFYIYKQK
ncbi:MAG TPA: hypothetical protein DCL60_12355, partial [Armatimonadetes bacterium]|nr:hypothetical protein [Armatimonadota bacterium]